MLILGYLMWIVLVCVVFILLSLIWVFLKMVGNRWSNLVWEFDWVMVMLSRLFEWLVLG